MRRRGEVSVATGAVGGGRGLWRAGRYADRVGTRGVEVATQKHVPETPG